MSSTSRSKKGKKKSVTDKFVLDEQSNSPNQSDDGAMQTHASDLEANKLSKPAKVANRNDIVKSRLALIIDMLDMEDTDDDKTLRKNVTIAVKHLKTVAEML